MSEEKICTFEMSKQHSDSETQVHSCGVEFGVNCRDPTNVKVLLSCDHQYFHFPIFTDLKQLTNFNNVVSKTFSGIVQAV